MICPKVAAGWGRSDLARQDLAECVHRALGRGIDRQHVVADGSGGGANVDDAAASTLLHGRKAGLCEMQNAKQIDVKHVLEILGAVVEKRF